MNRTLPFLCLAFLSSVCLAESTETQTVLEAEKNSWIQQMETKLPALLCDPQQYFAQCYDVTEAECLNTMKLTVKSCLDNASLGIPDTLTEKDAAHWSAVVGRCSVDVYQKYMKSKKSDRPQCQVEPVITSP